MKQNLPGGLSAVVPPDPMPNSEVKRRSADGSVGSPHARVGNCQASNQAEGHPDGWPFCVGAEKKVGCDAGASDPDYSCLSVLILHPLHHKISQPLNIINIQ